MLSVSVLPQADNDLEQYFFYIAEDNPTVASLFLDRVEETQTLIAKFPKLGSIFKTEISELVGIRWFPVKDFPKHLIFYIEDEAQIVIVRILHKAQDISHILS